MLASTLRSVVPFETCALFLREGDRGVLRCRCSSGVDAERIARFVISEGEGLQGWVVRTERALMNAPPSLDFDAAGAVDIAGPTPLRSAVVCPLIFNSRVLGTLAVYHTKEHAYSDDDRRRLTHAAENAAAVIHRAVVFDEARLSAATDPMTGLPNARAMSIAVAREVARAGRLGTSGAVLAVDVRGVAGLAKDGPRPRDAATVRCAETVRLCLPHPDDMVGAVGRDVFVVLLASASAAEAAVVKTAIEERVAALSSQLGVELSARVGLALFPEEGETFDALWARANKAAGGAAQLTPVSAPTE
jgi:diguanylate cyclase (GGDEF)-like protein